MFIGKRSKELRENRELLQRQLAAELEIDTPMYSKIERGERRAKREQIIKLAELLHINCNELLALWLASQIYHIIEDKPQASGVIELIRQELNHSNQ